MPMPPCYISIWFFTVPFAKNDTMYKKCKRQNCSRRVRIRGPSRKRGLQKGRDGQAVWLFLHCEIFLIVNRLWKKNFQGIRVFFVHEWKKNQLFFLYVSVAFSVNNFVAQFTFTPVNKQSEPFSSKLIYKDKYTVYNRSEHRSLQIFRWNQAVVIALHKQILVFRIIFVKRLNSEQLNLDLA